MSGKKTPNQEVRRFRNAALISSIYHKGEDFQRKSYLSEFVHGTFHLCQLAVSVAIDIFHHVHHATNRVAQQQNTDLPTVPEEQNFIFAVFPICMGMSLILAILRFGTKILVKRPGIAMALSFICAALMLIGGMSAMRHVEIHVDVEEVPDDELLDHPVFIHNYIICLLSIFGCTMYLIQSWILYDFWQWERKELARGNTVNGTQASSSSVSFDDAPSVSRDSSNERRRYTKTKTKDKKKKKFKYDMQENPGILNPIVTMDILPSANPRESQLDVQSVKIDPETEPVVIYCCCLDLYRYTKSKYFTQKPTHEFQVVHVM